MAATDQASIVTIRIFGLAIAEETYFHLRLVAKIKDKKVEDIVSKAFNMYDISEKAILRYLVTILYD